MLRLEQMTDGELTVYRMVYKDNGITITKYFQEIDNKLELDETQLKSVDDGLHIEIK